MEPWESLREEREALGLAMSVYDWRAEEDFANKRFWLVERVWLWTGIWSCAWIRVLSWAIVMFGLSTVTRSSPSRLRIRSIIVMVGAVDSTG